MAGDDDLFAALDSVQQSEGVVLTAFGEMFCCGLSSGSSTL
jgi:hypothetical protein